MRGRGFAVIVALCAVLPPVSAAQAMQIRQFDKMADQDQSAYLGDMIVAAEQVLTDGGQPDLAAKIKYLFTTKEPGDKDVIGMVEIERNIAIARVADAKRAAGDPNARRLDVEDAFALTMKKNGIPLPGPFFTALSNFQPKFPPQP